MSDTLQLSLAISVVAVTCVLLSMYLRHLYHRYQITLMMEDVVEWLETYQKRVTGNNRFVINQSILQEAFPEYSPAVVRAIWHDMRQTGMVKEDVMDKEWIVRS